MSTQATSANQSPSPKPTTKADLPTGQISRGRQNFLSAAVTMSWQLALVVLLPIIGGVKLDQLLKTSPNFTIVGFVLAMIGVGLVMWRTLQVANRLPVPKLTAEQKRDIQRQYAEDDADD